MIHCRAPPLPQRSLPTSRSPYTPASRVYSRTHICHMIQRVRQQSDFLHSAQADTDTEFRDFRLFHSAHLPSLMRLYPFRDARQDNSSFCRYHLQRFFSRRSHPTSGHIHRLFSSTLRFREPALSKQDKIRRTPQGKTLSELDVSHRQSSAPVSYSL